LRAWEPETYSIAVQKACSQPRLLKCDGTAKRCLDRKALASPNVVENPLLEFEVRLGTNWIMWKEPLFSSAARSSALNQSMWKEERGKRLLFPLPGGPATTVMRGRGKLSAEVGTCVLAHVLGEFVLQKAALFVDNSQANGFRALRLIKLVPVSQDLRRQSVKFFLVIDIHRLERKWSRHLHSTFIIGQSLRCNLQFDAAAGATVRFVIMALAVVPGFGGWPSQVGGERNRGSRQLMFDSG